RARRRPHHGDVRRRRTAAPNRRRVRRAARACAGGARMRRAWPPLALLALVVVAWQAVVRLFDVPDYVFPAPTAVASSFDHDFALLSRARWVTVREVLLGYLLAVAVALAVAVLVHFSQALRRAVLPILVLSQTVPTVVLAPVLAILLGYGLTPKLVVVAV